MSLRPPSSTRTDTRLPYTTLSRSPVCSPAYTGSEPGSKKPRLSSPHSPREQPPRRRQRLPRPLAAAAKGHAAHDQVPHGPAQWRRYSRSEEHTSELQSLMRISYAVFCLKKNNNTKRKDTYYKNQPKQ